jgi:modulator of FtsH protease
MTAFASTAGVFFTMATLATVIKRDLRHGQVAVRRHALAVMIGAVINVFVGSSAMAWP